MKTITITMDYETYQKEVEISAVTKDNIRENAKSEYEKELNEVALAVRKLVQKELLSVHEIDIIKSFIEIYLE